jgi:hypothetical protein
VNINSKKTFLCIALFSCLVVALSAVTYGMLFVASNSIHVDVQYEVDLTHSIVDSEVTLNAEVSNNGNPVGAGYIVDFYYSVDGSEWTYFDTQITSDLGLVQSIFVITTNGAYDFRAILTIP